MIGNKVMTISQIIECLHCVAEKDGRFPIKLSMSRTYFRSICSNIGMDMNNETLGDTIFGVNVEIDSTITFGWIRIASKDDFLWFEDSPEKTLDTSA